MLVKLLYQNKTTNLTLFLILVVQTSGLTQKHVKMKDVSIIKHMITAYQNNTKMEKNNYTFNSVLDN